MAEDSEYQRGCRCCVFDNGARQNKFSESREALKSIVPANVGKDIMVRVCGIPVTRLIMRCGSVVHMLVDPEIRILIQPSSKIETERGKREGGKREKQRQKAGSTQPRTS